MIITKKGLQESTIQIEENFRASKEKVFKALTKPESLKKMVYGLGGCSSYRCRS